MTDNNTQKQGILLGKIEKIKKSRQEVIYGRFLCRFGVYPVKNGNLSTTKNTL